MIDFDTLSTIAWFVVGGVGALAVVLFVSEWRRR